MTSGSDRSQEMDPRASNVDEVVADILVAGRPTALAGTHPAVAAVADFVADLRATVRQPPAPPSAALAAILRDGLPTPDPALLPTPAGSLPASASPRTSRAAVWRRRLASVALGFTVAGGGVTAAAATDLLPAGPRAVVRSVVEALTPFEMRGASTGHVGPTGSGGTRRDAGSSTSGSTGGPTDGRGPVGGGGGTGASADSSGPAGSSGGASTSPSGGTGSAATSGSSAAPPGEATSPVPSPRLPAISTPGVPPPDVPSTTTPPASVPPAPTLPPAPTVPAHTLPGPPPQ